MVLETLDILYITLSIFTAVIWTLLAVVLFKVIKILWPVMELVNWYKKVKAYLSAYRQVPEIVKESVLNIIKKDDKQD